VPSQPLHHVCCPCYSCWTQFTHDGNYSCRCDQFIHSIFVPLPRQPQPPLHHYLLTYLLTNSVVSSLVVSNGWLALLLVQFNCTYECPTYAQFTYTKETRDGDKITLCVATDYNALGCVLSCPHSRTTELKWNQFISTLQTYLLYEPWWPQSLGAFVLLWHKISIDAIVHTSDCSCVFSSFADIRSFVVI